MEDLFEFHPPSTMTTHELGDSLARLVWESFSDFLAKDDVETPLPEAHPVAQDEIDPQSAEEALIFFMWAHTRGTQLAFLGRTPDSRVKEGLDALHKAVFDDMATNGTPKSQIPFFEQRVSARYAEYHQAAAESDDRLGEAVCRHLSGTPEHCITVAEAITERAIAVANPLRDFLADVELVD
jgi:hypothetical protein